MSRPLDRLGDRSNRPSSGTLRTVAELVEASKRSGRGKTCEVYGQQLTIYCVELPRVMELTDNFDSPVAGWCRIFRNIANFAEMRDGRFGNVVKEMKVRGLDEQEMIEYFSDMVTIDDIKPFIDGGHELGYRKGLKDGIEEGVASIVTKLLQSGMTAEAIAKATGLPIETVLSYRS